jgi:MFS family permease
MPERDPNFKRNFTLGVLNGTFFMAALAFVAGSTVLPVFISKLTDSNIIVGIISHVEWFGWLFPQIFAASILVHRKRVLSFYNGLSAIRLILFAVTIALIFYFADNPTAILISFAIGFTIFSLFSGLAGLAFMEVVGKTIPNTKRGSFFGLRFFSGGLLAALAGLLIKRIMTGYEFPYDFGIICSLAWALMFMGLIMFALQKEPEKIDLPKKESPNNQIKNAFNFFKNDSNYRQLIFSKIWANSYYMSTPFFVILAIKELQAPDWMAGIYLTSQMTGFLISNLLWARVSDKMSNKLVILLSSAFRLIPPIFAVSAFFINFDPYLFVIVFFLIGATEAGIDIGFMNYLLEISPESGRPLYVGFFNTVIAPTVLVSGLGGWIIQIFSLKFLFSLVMFTSIIALLNSLKLREPRPKSA